MHATLSRWQNNALSTDKEESQGEWEPSRLPMICADQIYVCLFLLFAGSSAPIRCTEAAGNGSPLSQKQYGRRHPPAHAERAAAALQGTGTAGVPAFVPRGWQGWQGVESS